MISSARLFAAGSNSSSRIALTKSQEREISELFNLNPIYFFFEISRTSLEQCSLKQRGMLA
jgi:hypothetical protein